MPVFAHQPAAVISGSGEVVVALSEPARRNRGTTTFRDPVSGDDVLVCREAPHRRERLGWLFASVQQGIPFEPTLTPILVRERSSAGAGGPAVVRYLRHAQGLGLTYHPTSEEFHLLFWWNLFTPPKSTPPATPEESQVRSFLSAYKEVPIAWTLTLGEHEPHARRLSAPDPHFPGAVGDPPLDPGGAWPGVYNGFDPDKTLSVGGAAWSKGFDPFQLSDAHRQLPGSPGMVVASAVQDEGSRIDLGAVEGLMNDDTQHLYHQREVQGSRMATPVLMSARGFLYNLEAEEEAPDGDDATSVGTTLVIGSSTLAPAVRDEAYVGLNRVNIQNTEALFPFGVLLPGFVSVIPGEQGHRFRVSGGQPPYSWCLRRTRPSASDPAREPVLPGSPPSPPVPYPFDDRGDLVDPPPDSYPRATAGGGLPPGMLLDQDGFLYGTPLAAGVFLFRLHVKDTDGLRGETTIRLWVRATENDAIPCSTSRTVPATYKATIAEISLPRLQEVSQIDGWKGRVQAVGGETGKYTFLRPVPDEPSFLKVGVGDGRIDLAGLDAANFEDSSGVWTFEVEAREVTAAGIFDPAATCDRWAACLAVGTTRIAGVSDGEDDFEDGVIPEGKYRAAVPSRTYMVLETPTVVWDFPGGKNVYLRGNRGFPLRPDIGGLNLSAGIVTSLNPGVVNPVQVVGLQVDALSPSHGYADWSYSNPTDFFREIFDRFDPVPVSPAPPAPPGTPPLEGTQIDDLIPIGKRIRPLWPV